MTEKQIQSDSNTENQDSNKEVNNTEKKSKKVSKSSTITLGILVCILMVGIGILIGSNINFDNNGISDKFNNKELKDITQEDIKEELKKENEEKQRLLGEEEKAILAGKIVVYTLDEGEESGALCKLDLNLDGEKEQISIGELEFDVANDTEKFDIMIDDSKVTYEDIGVIHEVVAFALNNEQIIIATHASGMSDDYVTNLYTYDGKKINNAGSFTYDICAANEMESESIIIKENSIRCHSQEGTISNYVYRDYEWNGKKLVRKEAEVLDYANQDEELILKKKLKVFSDYNNVSDSETTVIEPGVVHPIKKGPNNWNYIRSEDGKEGWFTISLDEYFTIFENMNMAG